MAFTPRYTQPTDLSTWYGSYNSYNRYSSYGNEGNCTWYAYGRTGEIAHRNIYNEFYITQAPGNGKDWIYNTWPSYTHTSGSIDIQLGDILVWGGGTYGHVEVVEAINGNTLTTSYSISGSTWASSRYFATRNITTPSWGSYLGTVEYNDGSTAYLTNTFIGYIHNPYADPTPPGPTPSKDLEITISPSGYTKTMQSSETYVDFPFTITITGIPDGETVSGGNTYPGLIRVANTGWSYTDYTIDGTTYRRATKSQTLRYNREHDYSYSITKHMYFNLSFETGTISTDTLMYISVMSTGGTSDVIYYYILRKRKRGRINGYIV